jgi:hypothetical protein
MNDPRRKKEKERRDGVCMHIVYIINLDRVVDSI